MSIEGSQPEAPTLCESLNQICKTLVRNDIVDGVRDEVCVLQQEVFNRKVVIGDLAGHWPAFRQQLLDSGLVVQEEGRHKISELETNYTNELRGRGRLKWVGLCLSRYLL